MFPLWRFCLPGSLKNAGDLQPVVAVSGSSLGLIITGPLVPFLLNLSGDSGWRVSWAVLGGMVILVSLCGFVVLRDKPQAMGLEPVGRSISSSTQLPKDKPPVGIKSWGLVFKSPTVWRLALIYSTFGFSYIIYVTFFAKYLQDEVGWSKESAGNLWQMVGWISIFCGMILGMGFGCDRS